MRLHLSCILAALLWSSCCGVSYPQCPVYVDQCCQPVIMEYQPICVAGCPVTFKPVQECCFRSESPRRTQINWCSGVTPTKAADNVPDTFDNTPLPNSSSDPSTQHWTDVTLRNNTGKNLQLCMKYTITGRSDRHSPCYWIRAGETLKVALPEYVQSTLMQNGERKVHLAITGIDPENGEVKLLAGWVETDSYHAVNGRAKLSIPLRWERDR